MHDASRTPDQVSPGGDKTLRLERAPWGTPVSNAFLRSASACSGVGLYIGSASTRCAQKR